MQIQGKTVIITGASAGLGKAAATVFAKAGANIVMAAREAARLSQAAQDIRDLGAGVLAIPTDVSKADDVEQMVRATLEMFGRVDVLINNAAINYPAPIIDLTIEQWNQIVAVNLSGVFYVCKAVFPTMIQQTSGYIINISSIAGKQGWPTNAAYCATKGALTGFTQAIQAEAKAHNIRCTVVYPGGMDTDWHKGRDRQFFLDPATVAHFLLQLVTQDQRCIVNEAVLTSMLEPGG